MTDVVIDLVHLDRMILEDRTEGGSRSARGSSIAHERKEDQLVQSFAVFVQIVIGDFADLRSKDNQKDLLAWYAKEILTLVLMSWSLNCLSTFL